MKPRIPELVSGLAFDDRPAGGDFHVDFPRMTPHGPIFLIEMPLRTPRELALQWCSDEAQTQRITLLLEIARAEKRYAATLKGTR